MTEHVGEVRRCLEKGAHAVQIDFTEGRLAVKLDPTGTLLASFIDLNNLALARFTAEERKRIGVHTCPGGDRDSTHSADVDYAELLPSLLQLNLTNYYVALAGETDRRRVLEIIREHLKPGQRIFVGVVSPIDPHDRDARGGPRPRPRGRRVHPARAARHDRRLRLLAVQRRHVDHARHRVRQDRRPRSRHRAGRRSAAGRLMQPDDEEKQLRSAALQNVQSILQARQRAEQELLKTKEALEEETRILELLNQTGATLASKLDLQSVVQAVTDAGDRAQRRAVRRVLLHGEQRRGRRVHAVHAVGRAARGVREVRPAARDADLRADLPRRGRDPHRRRPRGSALRADGPAPRHAAGPPAGAQLPRGPGDLRAPAR